MLSHSYKQQALELTKSARSGQSSVDHPFDWHCEIAKRVSGIELTNSSYSKIAGLIEASKSWINDNFFKDLLHHSSSNTLSFKVATASSQELNFTHEFTPLPGEIYRFALDPFVVFPGLLDFVVSAPFRRAFQVCPSFRISGIHLRFSSPFNSSQFLRTTGFHRDYNSFKTLKLFVPLHTACEPFLEYYPSTSLKDT